MDLRATINGVQYDIVQGATFAEEFNETLDSGSIIISGVAKIKDLTPYDDVYIYSFTDKTYKFKGYPFDETNPQPKFYKHLLVDQFTEEVLRLGDSEEEGRYKYKIELMSETKKLETIQLPNISITQPIVGKKTSVWEYINRFVDLYSPIYKEQVGYTNVWRYRKKYTVSETLKPIFEKVYSPDFVLNTPSLRALISKFLLVKDIIPYVKDDVIYGIDISKRYGEFDANPRYVNIITGSRTSDNHCDNLRRNYSDALSQDRTCRAIEYVGFRNSDKALMTIANMRLELGMPIYKIHKIYLCYYKNIKVNYAGAKDETLRSKGEQTAVMLCKQDISKLVLLNTRRNAISQDWMDLHENDVPTSVDEMAQFKFCTLGYDIGSRYITGWGEIYTYPTMWNDNKFTYIQNIAAKMDAFYPFGIYDAQYVAKQFADGAIVYPSLDTSFWEYLVDKKMEGNTNGTVTTFFSTVQSPFTNSSLKLKGFFFIVDYEGFYNGAIVHSKQNDRDDIVINDNSSESLTLVEQDAVYQTEKVNRFGNKALQINARYDKFYDENGNENIQPLGSVYESSYEDDVVIYHREYSIYNNYVQCIYYGIKNYVLKNWFTSVYARYRTWNLMSYNESIKRAENEKEYIYWSDDSLYFEKNENCLIKDYTNSSSNNAISDILSCFNPWGTNDIVGYYRFALDKQINTAYIYLERTNTPEYYASDLNSFTANNSICFDIKMYDNFSQGLYISTAEPFSENARESSGSKILDWISKSWDWFMNAKDDYSGSKQDYWSIVDSERTGETKALGFYVGRRDKADDKVEIWESSTNTSELTTAVKKIYNEQLFPLPKIGIGSGETIKEKIGIYKDFYKDNKSFIDMTLQIENINRSKNAFISPWVMKLSDIMGDFPKFDSTIKDTNSPITGKFQCIVSSVRAAFYQGGYRSPLWAYDRDIPIIAFKFSRDFYDKISNLDGDITFNVNLKLKFYLDTDLDISELADLANPITPGSIMLNTFDVKTFTFLSDKKYLELKGNLNFYFKSDSSYSSTTQSDFAMRFRIVGEKGESSLAGSILPYGSRRNPEEDKDYPMGVNFNSKLVWFSNMGDDLEPQGGSPATTNYYIWRGVYQNAPKSNLPIIPFPNQLSQNLGGYAKGEDYVENKFIFYINGTKHILPDYANKGFGYKRYSLSDCIFCALGQKWKTELDKWINYTIMDCPNYVIDGEMTSSDTALMTFATYHKNMYLVLSDKTIDKQIIYDNYQKQDLNFREDLKVSDYIKFKSDENGQYIEIKVPEDNNVRSLSYYYLDDRNAYDVDSDVMGFVTKFDYNATDCYYHFVFGINIPEDWDRTKPYKVYLSNVARKDMRVFDKYHQVIGKSLNYAEHPEQYALGENFSDYDNDSLPNVKDFSTLTWKYIKKISDTGLASKYWKVGDTKTFTSKSGNVYTIRIVDMKYGRYSFVKGGSNHMVLEFVECVKLDGQTTFDEGLDADNNYIGSTLQTAVLKNIFDDLPDDLQAVIAEVNIDVYNNTSLFKFENPISTAGKLFLPSVSELTLSYGSNNFINTVMEYYIGDTAEARRIKSEKYWTRDCYYSNVPSMSFATLYYVDTDGGITPRFDSGVARKAGVAPFFAI